MSHPHANEVKTRARFAPGGVACASVILFGCSHEGSLRTRAAFDFQCTEDELSITDLGGGARGVEGCGHRATYVWRNSYPYTSGQWLLNSDSK